MKRILITTLAVVGLLIVAPVAGAHGTVSGESGSMMQAGDSAVQADEYAEMDDVMNKMMSGEELSATETEEMLAFMQSHHGSGYNMMGMLGSHHGYGINQGWMMGQSGSFLPWTAAATTLVWLLVGILAAIYLFRKLLSTN